jgi:hypothetical protein
VPWSEARWSDTANPDLGPVRLRAYVPFLRGTCLPAVLASGTRHSVRSDHGAYCWVTENSDWTVSGDAVAKTSPWRTMSMRSA